MVVPLKSMRAVTTTIHRSRASRILPLTRCFIPAGTRPFSNSRPNQQRTQTEPTMAWRCSGSSNQQLVNHLTDAGLVQSPAVVEAMLATDRAHYVPAKEVHMAYTDSPLPVGYAATISAPHMHAMCLELMERQLTKQDAKCLDIGSGSGYLTAVMGRLVREKGGRAYGVEHIRELVDWSIENVRRDDPSLEEVVQIVHGDGRLGLPAYAPFDCIHVGAASPSFPVKLIKQLKVGGRLVVPEGDEGDVQYLNVYDRVSDDPDAPNFGVKKSRASAVRYVPLTDESSQRGKYW